MNGNTLVMDKKNENYKLQELAISEEDKRMSA
jgi:hypothetical protein